MIKKPDRAHIRCYGNIKNPHPLKGGDLKYFIIWFVKIFSILFALGMTVIIAHTWFLAYFHHDRVLITINDVGERDAELLMWIIGGPVIAYGIALVIRDVWHQGYMSRRRLRKLIFGREDTGEWL